MWSECINSTAIFPSSSPPAGNSTPSEQSFVDSTSWITVQENERWGCGVNQFLSTVLFQTRDDIEM